MIDLIRDNKITSAILLFTGIVVCMRVFVFGSYIVPTSSMENTINISDCLIGNKLAYINSIPDHGDIITFKDNDGKVLVKRVIALPGDEIDIRDRFVYLNGVRLYESYTNNLPTVAVDNISYPYKLKDDEIWVMGDNRTNSLDSRFYGAINISQVESKIVFRFFPFNNVGVL